LTVGPTVEPASGAPPAGGGVARPSSLPPVSVLYRRADEERHETRDVPEFFRDLHLDQIMAAATRGREEYDLAPFFQTALTDPGAIAYRQEIMRDLERPGTRQAVDAFAAEMRLMRQHLGSEGKAYYAREKQRWHLAAAESFTDAAERLARDLAAAEPSSAGLSAFRSALDAYLASSGFRALAEETRDLARRLTDIHFSLLIREGTVRVRLYEGETDYGAAVEETFRKFAAGMTSDLRLEPDEGLGLNHVDAEILNRVALLNPEVFDALARFSERWGSFAASLLRQFDREVQFYLAWLDFIGRFQQAGLPTCYPRLTTDRADVSCRETYDLALADQLLREAASHETSPIVTNDFALHGPERVLVVTGPNQGGKTTFARTFGQLHHLVRLGCLVAGREARLHVCDRLFTHFEREEDVASLHGKLEDDLVRIKAILDQATPDSVVVLNEIFSSTTVEDALFLARQILASVLDFDLLCVCVTFLDELSELNEKTVSLVAAVDPSAPASRTYKLERRPANGLAYALALAEKHRLTYQQLKERVRS
jgi:DNA mismatch repair protein MutS